jgi:hypothetical protein
MCASVLALPESERTAAQVGTLMKKMMKMMMMEPEEQEEAKEKGRKVE